MTFIFYFLISNSVFHEYYETLSNHEISIAAHLSHIPLLVIHTQLMAVLFICILTGCLLNPIK